MHKSVTLRYDSIVSSLAVDLDLDELTQKYVLKRLNAEGVVFLTKTLPLLSAAVLRSLELGYFDRPTQFAWKGASLRYFSVWLSKIFDDAGCVRSDSCPIAIYRLRQFCDYFYKLSFEQLPEDIESSVEKAVAIESDLSCELNREWAEKIRKLFLNLFSPIRDKTVVDVLTKCRPRFGPGTFFGSENKPVPFFVHKVLPDQHIGTTTKDFGALSGYFRPYPSCKKTPIRLVQEGKCSKTLFVPKDSRGPRIISKEPLHLLRAQMAFFDWFSERLNYLSHSRINFSDQDKNKQLARESSVTREYATIDLKDASDRVRFDFAAYVFRDVPCVRYFLWNARSTHTVVGDRVVPLRKLSGMGSGLTFPIMSVLIYLSIIQCVSDRIHLAPNKVAKHVYVYGDDVVVPVSWYNYAVEGISASHLLVNEKKSFAKSHFRESCGGDFYKGSDVTIARLKLSSSGLKTWKAHRYSVRLSSDAGLYQLDRHCRELVSKGLITLSEYYYTKLENFFGLSYGFTSGDSETLGRYQLEPLGLENAQFERVIARPVGKLCNGMCPYKYLSRFLKFAGDTWDAAFGVLATPRKLKLKRELVSGIRLR